MDETNPGAQSGLAKEERKIQLKLLGIEDHTAQGRRQNKLLVFGRTLSFQFSSKISLHPDSIGMQIIFGEE